MVAQGMGGWSGNPGAMGNMMLGWKGNGDFGSGGGFGSWGRMTRRLPGVNDG